MGELIIYLFALIGSYTVGHRLTTMLLNKFFGKRASGDRNSGLMTENKNLKILIDEFEKTSQSNIENSFKNGVGFGVCMADPNAPDEFITECQNVSWRENQK